MFYLRTVSKGVTLDQFLGERYQTFTKKDNPKKFQDLCLEKEIRFDVLRKVIIFDKGFQFFVIPDESKDKFYIITENGNTYTKL